MSRLSVLLSWARDWKQIQALEQCCGELVARRHSCAVYSLISEPVFKMGMDEGDTKYDM